MSVMFLETSHILIFFGVLSRLVTFITVTIRKENIEQLVHVKAINTITQALKSIKAISPGPFK